MRVKYCQTEREQKHQYWNEKVGGKELACTAKLGPAYPYIQLNFGQQPSSDLAQKKCTYKVPGIYIAGLYTRGERNLLLNHLGHLLGLGLTSLLCSSA